MDSVGNRIKRAREQMSMSRTQLSKLSKVGYSTIAELENGGMRTSTKLHMLATHLGVTVEWLATGSGPARPVVEQSGVLDVRDEWATSIKKNNRDIQIPLLDSRASMGNGTPLTDYVNVVEMVTANLPELRTRVSFSAPHNLRLLTGYGDSMSPTFNDGDVLLIDVGVTDLKLDAVYVLERQDQLYVKRIQRRPTGALRMISDNPVYPPEDIDPEADGFAVLARVLCVWNFRKL
tara:strand:+ start:837 stop:1538 length:702 start_codon:yes stop_codon:yes gene_type:complete